MRRSTAARRSVLGMAGLVIGAALAGPAASRASARDALPVSVCLHGGGPYRAPEPPTDVEDFDVRLATSKDGVAWTLVPGVRFERSAGAELFLGRDDRLTLHCVEGSWKSPVPVAHVRGADGAFTRTPTDLPGIVPSILRTKAGGFEAYVRAPDDQTALARYRSDDGLHWRADRIVYHQQAVVADPDVFLVGDRRVLFVGAGAATLRAEEDVGGGFGTGHALPTPLVEPDTVVVDGVRRTFVTSRKGVDGRSEPVVSSFLADADGTLVRQADAPLALSKGDEHVSGPRDPSVVRTPDGTWWMAYAAFRAPRMVGPSDPPPPPPPTSPATPVPPAPVAPVAPLPTEPPIVKLRYYDLSDLDPAKQGQALGQAQRLASSSGAQGAEAFVTGKTLVLRATPEAHTAMTAVLESLRKP